MVRDGKSEGWRSCGQLDISLSLCSLRTSAYGDFAWVWQLLGRWTPYMAAQDLSTNDPVSKAKTASYFWHSLRSHTAPLTPHFINYKRVAIMSLKERDIDPTSWWRVYKRHIVRKKHVGWEILLRPSMDNKLGRYNVPCYVIFFFKSLIFKKLCPVLTLQVLFFPLLFFCFFFFEHFKAYSKSLLHFVLDCG